MPRAQGANAPDLRPQGQLAADYSAATGKNTQPAINLPQHRVTWQCDRPIQVMVHSVLLPAWGHETHFHPDVTDRDRDESSRRAISTWVRTNPQTHGRWRARIACPDC